MDDLYKGAIKSAVSSASGLVLSLPMVDPNHFSMTTLTGVGHTVGIIVWVVVIAEARFWKAWAEEVGIRKPSDKSGG